MALRLSIDGVGVVEVDDSFANLSPEEQAKTVDQITAQAKAQKGGSRFEGVSDDAVNAETGFMAGLPTPGVNTPVLGPLRRGAARAVDSLANSVEMVSPAAAAQMRKGNDQEGLNARSASDDFKDNWKQGNYLTAVSSVPSMALEAAPQLAAALGGAAAGGAAGGPVGAAVGGGLAGGVLTAGDIAKARAAYNGRTEMTPTDKVVGTLGGFAINAIPGMAPTTGMSRAGTGVLTSGLGRVATHAASDAAQGVAQHVLETAGTEHGDVVPDAADVAANVLTGAATRVGVGAGRAVVDRIAGKPPEAVAADRAKAKAAFDNLSPEEQQQVRDQAAAGKAMNDVKEGSLNRDSKHVPDNVAARTAADEIARRADDLLNAREADQTLSPEDVSAFRKLFADARSSQRTLGPDWRDAMSRNPEEGRLLPQVAERIKNTALPEPEAQALMAAARQIDMLSDAGIARRNQSKIEAVFGTLGAVGGALAGLPLGHPLVASGIGRRLAGAAGRKVAESLGMTAPHLVTDAQRAYAMMDAADIPIPDTKGELVAASKAVRDMWETQAKLLGVPLDGVASAREEHNRKAAGDFAAAAAERDQAAVDRSQAKTAEEIAKQRDKAYQELQRQRKGEAAKGDQIEAAYADVEAQKRAQEEALWAQHQADARANTSTDAAQNRRALAIGVDQNRANLSEVEQRAADRERSRNLVEREADRVSGMAFRKARRDAASESPVDAPGASPATGLPEGGQTPPTASQDAATATPAAPADGVTIRPRTKASRGSWNPMTELVPGNPQTHPDAAALGDWQFKLGSDLSKALHASGDPRKINPAMETAQSLVDLVARGDMPANVARALVTHKGAVIWSVYNLIRNDMLLRHGIDRRTLQAQGLSFDDFTPTQGHLNTP